MANFFLRYKYYLITRATADEIAIGIQPILFAVNCKTLPKIDPAKHSGAKVTGAHKSRHTAVMYAGASSGVVSRNVNRIRGAPIVRDTEHGKLPVEMYVPLGVVVNEYLGQNVSSEQTLDFQFHMTALVLLKSFLPVIEKDLHLTAKVDANVAELLKHGASIAGVSDISAKTELAEFISYGGRMSGHSKALFEAGTAVLSKLSGYAEIIAPFTPTAILLQAAQTKTIGCGITENTGIAASLFKRTKLSELDMQTLSALSVRPIRELDLTEIN